MKRAFWAILLLVIAGGGVLYWRQTHGAAGVAPAGAEAAPAEEAKITITHDASGNVVVNINDETQGNIGIVVAHPEPATAPPETRGYGRVLDPAPLAALANDLATAQIAAAASQAEWDRTKVLQSQGNTSARVAVAAEAAARHDELAVRALQDRLAQAWGQDIAHHRDLARFTQLLTAQETALVRIDLPAGESLAAPPVRARLVNLAGTSAIGQLIGPALNVDPQFQGQGFIFMVAPNQSHLRPGEAVAGYLQAAGEPLPGVIIPRDAVVRTEGAAWIYVLNNGAEALTRTPITLDRPAENGWFINQGVAATNHVVVVGAQTLLSQETKASLKPD